MNPGELIYNNIKNVFNLRRSLLGDGVRETLHYIRRELPDLKIFGIASGTSVSDWIIPEEWSVREAYIEDLDGVRIVDIKDNFLHLVGHSVAVDAIVSKEELLTKLHISDKRPDAIPYVTTYYSRDWGFCVTKAQKEKLVNSHYRVFVDSNFTKGELNYAELVLPGRSNKEFLFSSYVCHPNLANNELSGPFLQLELAKYVKNLKDREYSYRFVWVPETIGSISYLTENLQQLKKNVLAGFVLTCVGDGGDFSYMPSPYGDTLADKLAIDALNQLGIKYRPYSFLQRGSDERQYCSPAAGLPIVSIMRSKYGEYDEYHTSADNLQFITSDALGQTYNYYTRLISNIETLEFPIARCLGEPMLGKRGLYSSISKVGSGVKGQSILDFLSYCDGRNDLSSIAKLINLSIEEVLKLNHLCIEEGLVKV